MPAWVYYISVRSDMSVDEYVPVLYLRSLELLESASLLIHDHQIELKSTIVGQFPIIYAQTFHLTGTCETF